MKTTIRPEQLAKAMFDAANQAIGNTMENLIAAHNPSGFGKSLPPTLGLGSLHVHVSHHAERVDGELTGRRIVRSHASVSIRSRVYGSSHVELTPE